MTACSFTVVPDEPFGNAARLGQLAIFDLDKKGGIDELGRLLERLEFNLRPNRRTRPKGRREADFIQPVIDGHFDSRADSNRLAEKVAHQRKSQKAMRDASAEGSFSPGSLRINVDPLPVFGDVSKPLDPFLGNCKPVGDGEFTSFVRFQGIQILNLKRWHRSCL
jgi:hypothetical protein